MNASKAKGDQVMSDVILRINDLSKKYGSKTALDHVSFSVEKGKIYGFIGENGAGKTTAIRAITGLSAAPDGSIELFGHTGHKGLEEGRKKLGCLVERPILALNKTAYDNLAMQQILYGNSDGNKALQLLERVGLSDVKDKKVKDFSLGMKQRLGIALTLINDPELLILDEPVNGLDPVGMFEVRELLKSLCENEKITIVISSHILAELYQLVTDYIIISHGKIIETLSKDELNDKCTSYIVFETDRNDEAMNVLLQNGVEKAEQDGNAIKVYDGLQTRTIAEWMKKSNILVTLLMRNEISLEKYYMDLLGRT